MIIVLQCRSPTSQQVSIMFVLSLLFYVTRQTMERGVIFTDGWNSSAVASTVSLCFTDVSHRHKSPSFAAAKFFIG